MPYYCDLSSQERIRVIKAEYSILIRTIFNYPDALLQYIDKKWITNDQAKVILKSIDSLNENSCVCCRKWAGEKLQLKPINSELEPLVEIARILMRDKYR